jgi:protocatechuate 3,4-dioxygenase beta subunit
MLIDLHGTAIYPGYYTGRAVHIHTKVHPEWQVHPNGTFTPARLVHTGQFFFDENVNIEVDKVRSVLAWIREGHKRTEFSL